MEQKRIKYGIDKTFRSIEEYCDKPIPETDLNLRHVTNAKNLIMQVWKATSIFPQCGFCDYSTFCRSFVKFADMTPDEFKNNHVKKTKIPHSFCCAV